MYDANKEITRKGYNLLTKGYKRYPKGTHAKDWFEKDLPNISKKLPVYECQQEGADIVYVPWLYAHAVINMSDEVLGLVVETQRKNNI